MIIRRTKVFVGTSVEPTPQELERAIALSSVLFQRRFLPVMPFLYEDLLGAKGEDYLHIRLDLLKDCQSAIWLGSPSAVEAAMCVELGIVIRDVE